MSNDEIHDTDFRNIDIQDNQPLPPPILPPSQRTYIPGIEHDLNHNNIPDSDEVETCCSGTSDKRFHLMIIQTGLTLGISSMCLFKLADDTLDCDSSSLYVSLLSLVVGFYLTKVV